MCGSVSAEAFPPSRYLTAAARSWPICWRRLAYNGIQTGSAISDLLLLSRAKVSPAWFHLHHDNGAFVGEFDAARPSSCSAISQPWQPRCERRRNLMLLNKGKSVLINQLKRLRIRLNNRGYDLHPIDGNCWKDQRTLLCGQDDPVIFDVGANYGEVTATYKRLFPRCRVFCFEPQAEFLAKLEQRFGGDLNVSVSGAAVGSKGGKALLNINAGRDTSSLLRSDAAALPESYRTILRTEETREVELLAIDDFAASQGIARIDILKLDIQGGEYEALRGAERLLAEAKIGVIYTEVFLVPMYITQPLFGDLCKYLGGYGYTFHFLYNQVLNGRSGKLLWADAIFVSSALYARSREQLKTSWATRA
jgi:FkbM family methyltransferase